MADTKNYAGSIEKEILTRATTTENSELLLQNTVFRFSLSRQSDLFAESPIILHGFPEPLRWVMISAQHM